MREIHPEIAPPKRGVCFRCGVDVCKADYETMRGLEIHHSALHFILISKATVQLLQSNTETAALKIVLQDPDSFSRVIPGFMDVSQPPDLAVISAETPKLLPAALHTVNAWAPAPQSVRFSIGDPVARRGVLYLHLVLDALSVELPSQPWSHSELRNVFCDHFFGRAFWDFIVSGLRLALQAFSITSEKILLAMQSPDWRAISLEVLRLDFALATIIAQSSLFPPRLCQNSAWQKEWACRNQRLLITGSRPASPAARSLCTAMTTTPHS